MSVRVQPRRSLKLKSPLVPVLVLVLSGLQLFFPFKGWVILLSGFGGMWLFSFLWASSLKNRLNFYREIKFSWKQVGDRLRELVILDNHGWAPGLWVEIDDHSDMRDYEIGAVTEINGGRSEKWHTQGICNSRGLYTLGPVTMVTGDPFGIYSVSIDYQDSVNLMVVPPVMPLPEIEIASGQSDGQGRSLIKAIFQTVTTASIREYSPGDNLSWIHWPTTIRRGSPFVRVFEDEPTSDWWVVLDLDSRVQIGKGQKSTEEHGVILAASLVNRGLELGKKVGFISRGDELAWHSPKTGEAQLRKILYTLAKIRLGNQPLAHLLARIRPLFRTRTSLIIITSSLSSDWVDYLALLKRSGIAPTVLLLDPVSFGGSGEVNFLVRRLADLDIRHNLITSDLLDRPETKQKDGPDWLLHHPKLSRRGLDRWEKLWLKLSKNIQIWGFLLLFFWGMVRAMGIAVRGLDGILLWEMIAGSVGVILLLGRSKLPGLAVVTLHMILGWMAITFKVGQFGGPIRDAVAQLMDLLPQVISWIYRSTSQPYFGLFFLSLNDIWVRINAIGFRLLAWLYDMFRGQPFYDPVVIALIWGMAVWGAAAWAAWRISRNRRPLAGLLPSLAVVGLSLAFVQRPSSNLSLMLGAIGFLMIFFQFEVHESHWKTKEMSYSSSIRSKISTAAVLLGFGLAIVSIITPTISIKRFAEFFRSFSYTENKTQEFTNSLGLEPKPESGSAYVLDIQRAGGLPNSHLIGSGSELSDQVVMVFRIENYLFNDLEINGKPQNPFYLRSLTYDNYNGRGWTSRETQVLDYSPGEHIPTKHPQYTYQVRQQIQYIEDLNGILYTYGDLMSVDQDFQVAWRIHDPEVGEFDIFGVTIDSKAYRADSIVPIYSEVELRSAGQQYPDWVLMRYLNLPPSVPESVLTLARNLTAAEPTPYDRAVALESYLREIPYSLDVEIAPREKDVVEFFLFDSQFGYCDYYATAMVVLSRAAGFPARYVMGYIVENYDEVEDLFIVTADQAHAWVEVFFPDYGWVPFEPTGGRSGITRMEEIPPQLSADFSTTFAPKATLIPLIPDDERFPFDNWVLWTMVGSIILMATLIYWGITIWRMYLIQVTTLVSKLYKRIYRYGRWAGLSLLPGDTIYTFANELTQLFYDASLGSHWADWIRQSTGLITYITKSQVYCLFAPSLVNRVSRDEVIKTYQRLLPRFWLLWIMVRIYRFPILRPLFWRDASHFIQVMRDRIPLSLRGM